MTTYSWPLTINGVTFTAADFEPYGYVNAVPNLMGNFAAYAGAINTSIATDKAQAVAAAGTATTAAGNAASDAATASAKAGEASAAAAGASSSAGTTTTKAAEAANSASAAAASAGTATTKAGEATSAAASASTGAATATAKAGEAATSAGNAAGSATTATTKAGEASASAAAAAGSSTAAANSATAAAASAAQAATYAGGGIKVSATDTTHGLLGGKLTALGPLSWSVANAGGDERYRIAMDWANLPAASFTGQVLLPVGSVGAPGLAFALAPKAGLFISNTATHAIRMVAGTAGATSAGGNASIAGGSGGATAGNGGNGLLTGGAATEGNGGGAFVLGGSGASATGAARDGGAVTITGGAPAGTGAGGDVTISAGSGGTVGSAAFALLEGGAGPSGGGPAGGATVRAGLPVDGDGGSCSLRATAGVGTNRHGGSSYIYGGNATGTGTGGSITLTAGSSPSGTAGDISLITSGGGTAWLNGSKLRTVANTKEAITIAVSDETSAITAGTGKVTFRMPYRFTLTAVRASLTTASTSGTPSIDVNRNGSSIFSTTLTIDASERTSVTAATPAVLATTILNDDDEITIDVDAAGTGAKGLKVTLIGSQV